MTDTYAKLGVDVDKADRGIERIVQRVKATWGSDVLMDIGYFANVVDLGGGWGLATTTDGVGSKTRVAEIAGRYDTIGIDCVAMNVNDLICVGATPISMVDYIAVEKVDPDILDQIAIGLTAGAQEAGAAIVGGEVSQLPEIVNGFDLVGTANGLVKTEAIIDGSKVTPGDIIIGLASNGLHSNGYTLARRILLRDSNLDVDRARKELHGRSIMDELLRPTAIYVKEVLELIHVVEPKALVHITGDGLLNLNRVQASDVGFMIDMLPALPPVFDMIQRLGAVDDATMYQTFNNGIGFCAIVDASDESTAYQILNRCSGARILGRVIEDNTKSVYLPEKNLIGRGKRFHQQT